MTVPPPPIDMASLPPVLPPGPVVNAASYRDVPVDPDHPLYSEALVDLADLGIAGLAYYHIADGTNPPYHQRLDDSMAVNLLRKSVAERLIRVNDWLAPLGLELFVWDGYRPLQTQICLWRFFEAAVRRDHPTLGADQVFQEVIKFVSDPRAFVADDPRTWPTHMTGASVDLTIRRKADQTLLDMGADFDQMDAASHSDHFETLWAAGMIGPTDPRLVNRRLLIGVMAEAGFTNYPLEYWHFDWGNQMFQQVRASHRGTAPQPAFYGACHAP